MGDAATASRGWSGRSAAILVWVAAAVVSVLFMTLHVRGSLAFAMELRSTQLLAILQVGVAVAVSTVLFQTITGNRILSPSIMGLDALYLFCQTALVFVLGGVGYAMLDRGWKFGGEIAAMMAMSLVLFLPLLRRRSEMMLMILAGVVLGIMFRSLSSLMARLVDPNAFAVVQGASFARFGNVDPGLLALTLPLILGGCLFAWRARHVLDVLSLGRDAAVGLGVNWERWVTTLLLLVAALTACATALVGPLAFLGLLVVALAERLCQTRRHAVLLPAAAGMAILVLAGAQTLGRAGLGGGATVSVIVEFAGGLVFLALLFSRRGA